MEKKDVVIVDEDDNLIGAKPRDSIDLTKDIYRVTGIWVTNSKGEVLIAKRSMLKKVNSGKWGPAVAGTVEEGETYESNAYKELEEEIGVNGIHLEIGPKLGPKELIGSPRKYFAQWFKCQIDKKVEEFKLQEGEVDEIKWVSYDDLKKDVECNRGAYIPSMSYVLKLVK
jgi:isopentenyldiphosphate isomerase